MLLLYFVIYFVVIMVGLVLPWWIWFDLWLNSYTIDFKTTAVGVACLSWVLGFWNWVRDLPGEDNRERRM